MSGNGHSIVSLPNQLPTRCKLCGKLVVQLKGETLDIPLSGPPGEKAMEYLKILLKHMTRHHPEEMLNHAKEFEEMQAWFLLCAYHHTDPSIEPRMERIRALMFSQCRRYSYTDEQLHKIVGAIDFKGDVPSQVETILRAVRDILTETGDRLNTAPEQPSRIITLQ